MFEIQKLSSSFLLALFLLLGVPAWVSQNLHAHKPEDPHVKEMVAKGVAYLEKSGESDRFGGKALIAMTLLKAGKKPDHPKVEEAVAAIQTALKENRNTSHDWESLYSPCLGMIFLCELDDVKYKKEISELLGFIYSQQRPDGSWTYSTTGTHKNLVRGGDISQVQYCCLAMWYARKHGIQVPKKRGKAVLDWLVNVQSEDGGFAYQPVVRADGVNRQKTSASFSLASAGMGAMYITGDWVGISDKKQKPEKGEEKIVLGPPSQEDFLPETVFAYVEGQEDIKKKIKTKFSDDDVEITVDGLEERRNVGDAWFPIVGTANMDRETWKYYAIYGYERYRAFHDIANDINEPEPSWYNHGVDFLSKNQKSDGSWQGISKVKGLGTAFAILFLTRSTRKAMVPKIQEAQLTGSVDIGKGELKMGRDGRLVTTKVTKDVDDLAVLAGSQNVTDEDWNDFRLSLSKIVVSEEPKKRAEQVAMIRSLIRHRNHLARIIAVTQLSRFRDYDSVPHLIYALSDGQPEVVVAANKALGVVSRRFHVEKLTTKNALSRARKIEVDWKNWYLGVQPDAIFLE